MLDPVVGGTSKPSQALRQAISIALNYEEYITIFLNGRGGSTRPHSRKHLGAPFWSGGSESYVYRWHQGAPQRRSLREAKQLMVQAGYPKGRIQNRPSLRCTMIPYRAVARRQGTSIDAQAICALYIVLDIRATQYNRFQIRCAKAKHKCFHGDGWPIILTPRIFILVVWPQWQSQIPW